MSWARISRHAMRSGKWLLAKQGGDTPKYLLTHDERPSALMWFSGAEAAKSAAERLDQLYREAA